jgi:probable FeS assembly SUF system protein SufT
MQQTNAVELSRDCEAVVIPHGHAVVLPKGTPVHITQTLGGSYTVQTPAGLFRISSKDADALGTISSDAILPETTERMAELSEGQIWETLRTCYDPEIPVNIVDLGLVYDMRLEKLPSGNRVGVKMTLTAPGCGMGSVIAGDAQEKLLMLDGVEEATVEIVWDPPWHQSMITAEGRRVLGIE